MARPGMRGVRIDVGKVALLQYLIIQKELPFKNKIGSFVVSRDMNGCETRFRHIGTHFAVFDCCRKFEMAVILFRLFAFDSLRFSDDIYMVVLLRFFLIEHADLNLQSPCDLQKNGKGGVMFSVFNAGEITL